MSVATVETIRIVCLVLGGVLALGHAVDLHTTSQILKRGLGHEADPLLGWALHSPRLSEDERFWLLSTFKLIQAAGVLIVAWVYPSPWLVGGEVALCLLYWHVLDRNYVIYRGKNREESPL